MNVRQAKRLQLCSEAIEGESGDTAGIRNR